MRRLHAVALHETFAASGIYTYYEDGQPTGTVEHWSIHELRDGSRISRVDHDERALTGKSLLLEALRHPDGQVVRFDVRFLQARVDPVKEARGNYTFFDGRVEIGRSVNRGERRDDEMSLPAKVVVYPPMWVFAGPTITQVAAFGGTTMPVFTLWLADPADERFLSGLVEYRSASILGTDELEIARGTLSARRFRFDGGDANALFWLDAQDLLVRHSYSLSNGKEGVVLLTQLARRPAPANHD